MTAFGEPTGQGWVQVGELAIAFALSAVIGLERELKQKAAGVRTYTVVGFGSALFVLVSKYGFTDVLGEHVTLDPSRVAAQIVSGLGFIGAGIIFVQRGSVRGLTTAASIWLTAAIGAAAGAGLPVLAALSTLGYFVAMVLLPPLARRARRFVRASSDALRVEYLDGRGLLRDVLTLVTDAGFLVAGVRTVRHSDDTTGAATVEVAVELDGKGDPNLLVAELADLDGVLSVSTAGNDDVE